MTISDILSQYLLSQHITIIYRYLNQLAALIPPSWELILSLEITKDYFQELDKQLQEESKTQLILPLKQNIFKSFEYVNLLNVKVLILGADPYAHLNLPTGLSFSVPPGQPIPPSLINIFLELTVDIPGFELPKHGDLTSWAKQGVFLLNSILTVRIYESNSHHKYGWEKFTDMILMILSHFCSNLVFILWGNHAKSKMKFIDPSKHLIVTGVHPSPLAADRGGFFGGKYFSKTNQYLIEHNKTPINWQI